MQGHDPHLCLFQLRNGTTKIAFFLERIDRPMIAAAIAIAGMIAIAVASSGCQFLGESQISLPPLQFGPEESLLFGNALTLMHSLDR